MMNCVRSPMTLVARVLPRSLPASLFLGALIVGAILMTGRAEASGTCVNGYRYRDAGTDHNYVEFRVNFSARNWHTHRPLWAYPIDLWANPQNGIGKAGIRGTDRDPWYSASYYQLCGTN